MRLLSSLLELLGLSGVVAGASLLDWRLGIVVAGLVLIILGLVLDPPRRSG